VAARRPRGPGTPADDLAPVGHRRQQAVWARLLLRQEREQSASKDLSCFGVSGAGVEVRTKVGLSAGLQDRLTRPQHMPPDLRLSS